MLKELLDILNKEEMNYSSLNELKSEHNLKDDLQLDSLDIAELLMVLEIEYNITIIKDDFITVGEIIEYIEKVK